MKKTIEKRRCTETYPDEKEIREAVKICCGRCCSACETPVEYAWRRRKIRLSYLMDSAIETELTRPERAVISAVYFDGLSYVAAAEKLGISRQTLHRTEERAFEKLRRAMLYAVMYAEDTADSGAALKDIGGIFDLLKAEKSTGKTTGEKLRNARVSRALTLRNVEKATGISARFIAAAERGEKHPDSEEIIKLCRVYGRRPDELLTEV